MSALSMSEQEREAFLADVHVGVLGVARADGPPSLTPVWYRYADGVVEVMTSSSSAKLDLIRAAGEVSFCVQREAPTPACVTVEGGATIGPSTPQVVLAIASRYLGPERGAKFAAGPAQQDDTLITLRVQRWRTADFSKIGF